MPKKLPIGVQSIEKLLSEDFIYVDKTDKIKQLIDSGSHYFIARPRRFGKSLFVSTLEAILKGNKDLFADCKIAKTDYDWVEHPVIHFDFAQIPNKSTDDLENSIKRKLEHVAKEHNISIEIPTLQEGLINLVKKLAEKNQVAILVDEYDKPKVDHLNNIEIADSNRDFLRRFFGTLKGLDQHLKFVFFTGVSKFAQVSLFSGLNNLEDLTMDPSSSELMGYTKDELKENFKEHIAELTKKTNCAPEQILKMVKEWYNGYCFSQNCVPVYNPFSTLSYFKRGIFHGYWFSTGTPAFLIEQIRKMPMLSTQLSGALSTSSELLDILSMTDVDLNALMWQTGYLTITAYDPQTDLYTLDFPNKEVRGAFFNSLIREFAKLNLSGVTGNAKAICSHLAKLDFETFFKTINAYYAKIPYHLFTQAKEGFYHAVFLCLMEGIGLQVRAEDPTNMGRLDLVIETDQTVYIFELKVDKSATVALDQAELNRYCEKYSHQNRNIAMIGVNFATATRNISDWAVNLYAPDANLIQKYALL